ncbi:hypothetical protein A1OO_15045 [Enterovibrio norvegicus FF-33]|uniref:Uncharacterized protein n=1 Tax=Enterovibrio norvegicus FF-454 TaxID=1185651 RepID=A0A1E5C3E0_9GAMM|nr:hypothetical protein [Enterovibrio norvegicus]OEE60004.1 hypothetical protein A1OK_12605 [Enterovibrio norvegicus FF-454]OEE67074.1 hypothetical protein A1OO_15045 [Enterovibrio norvegicus FF-33]
MLLVGSFLLIFIGFVHSYLGEKYILIRLFRRDNLPKLLGSDWFTKRVLRFAWHITTIAWWGFAAILYFLSNPSGDIRSEILMTIAVVFSLSGVVSLWFSRGKHLSWLFFFGIASTCLFAVFAH